MILPYSELITKILNYFNFELDEEESEIKHYIIGKSILSQMWCDIQGWELISLPYKASSREKQLRNNDVPPSSSNILNDVRDD